MVEFEGIGIHRRYLGESRFVTDRGTFQLTNLPRDVETWTGFARVIGEFTDRSRLDVRSVQLLGENESRPYPFHYGRAADAVWTAGSLRAIAHQYLWQRGFTETFLPSAWPRSEDAGSPELHISHPGIDPQRLGLQRLPETATYVTLASGLTNWYSFARSWHVEPEPTIDPKDNLFESERLTIARAGWSIEEMIAVASDLVTRLAESVGLHVPREKFETRDLSREQVNERFSRTVWLPPEWGSEVRRVVFDRLRRLQCDYSEGAGGDPNCLRVSGPAESSPHVQHMIRSIEMARSTEISAELLRTMKLHPTWIMHPPLAGGPENASLVGNPVNAVFTARLEGADPPRLLQATLNLAGLAVGGVSIYADARALRDHLRMGSRDEASKMSYLAEMATSAPPGLGSISFSWERLCSRLTGSSNSAAMQAIGRLATGGLLSKSIGPK